MTMTKTEESKGTGQEFKAQFFVIAFLDLLGTKKRFNRMADLFEASISDEKKKQILIESKKPLLEFRKVFEKYYSSYNRKQTFRDVLRNKHGITAPQVVLRFFSDSVILMLPLVEKEGVPVVLELLPMIDACSTACLMCLSKGYPVRGGIELGVGVEIGDREVTGKVLADAVDLEKKAEFPRVIIGKKLLEFLIEAKSKNPQEDQIKEKINKDISKQVYELLYRDIGDVYSLDYLGKQASGKLQIEEELFWPIITKVIENVERCLVDYEEEIIQKKYRYLKNYIISKIGEKEYKNILERNPE